MINQSVEVKNNLNDSYLFKRLSVNPRTKLKLDQRSSTKYETTTKQIFENLVDDKFIQNKENKQESFIGVKILEQKNTLNLILDKNDEIKIGEELFDHHKLIENLKEFDNQNTKVLCMLLFNRKYLVSGDASGNLKLWEIESNNIIYSIEFIKNSVNSIINLNEQKFCVGLGFGNVVIIEKKTFKPIFELKEHFNSVKCLLTVNNNYLISGGVDSLINIYLWQDTLFKCYKKLEFHEGSVNTLASVSTNQLNFYSCSSDSSIRLFNFILGKELKSWKAHKGIIWSIVDFSENNILISAGEDNQIKIWNSTTFKLVSYVESHKVAIYFILKLSSTIFISSDASNTLKLFSINNEEANCLKTVKLKNGPILNIAKLDDSLLYII